MYVLDFSFGEQRLQVFSLVLDESETKILKV